MRKILSGTCMALALSLAAAPVGAEQPQIAPKELVAVAKSLKPQQGKVVLPDAKATLDLGTQYDFYSPDDARKILVSIWGNPPESAEGVLGLVMKHGTSPLQDAWGAVVAYEPTGYVPDKDAAEVDYGEMLNTMREGEADNNSKRKAAGYPEIHLVGWAEQPAYDAASHSVVWARDLKFSDGKVDTLNYDVRTLGRGGVLSLNLISSMDHLADVKQAAHEFASHASFDSGARYADFNPDIDKQAEYGIGGLVAAGAGVVVAKKLGLLALMLKFIKPLLFAVVAGFAAFKNKLLGLFGRNRDPLEGE